MNIYKEDLIFEIFTIVLLLNSLLIASESQHNEHLCIEKVYLMHVRFLTPKTQQNVPFYHPGLKQNWNLYFRPPWSFIYHLLEIGCLTYFFIFVATPTINFCFLNRQVFVDAFYPDYDYPDEPITTLDEITDYFESVVDSIDSFITDSFMDIYISTRYINTKNSYKYNNIIIQNENIKNNVSEEIDWPILCEIVFLNGTRIYRPLDLDEMDFDLSFFYHLSYITISVDFYVFSKSPNIHGCSRWQIESKIYAKDGFSQFSIIPSISRIQCNSSFIATSNQTKKLLQKIKNFQNDTIILNSITNGPEKTVPKRPTKRIKFSFKSEMKKIKKRRTRKTKRHPKYRKKYNLHMRMKKPGLEKSIFNLKPDEYGMLGDMYVERDAFYRTRLQKNREKSRRMNQSGEGRGLLEDRAYRDRKFDEEEDQSMAKKASNLEDHANDDRNIDKGNQNITKGADDFEDQDVAKKADILEDQVGNKENQNLTKMLNNQSRSSRFGNLDSQSKAEQSKKSSQKSHQKVHSDDDDDDDDDGDDDDDHTIYQDSLKLYRESKLIATVLAVLSLVHLAAMCARFRGQFRTHLAWSLTRTDYRSLPTLTQFHFTIGFWPLIDFLCTIVVFISAVFLYFDTRSMTQFPSEGSIEFLSVSMFISFIRFSQWLGAYLPFYQLTIILREAFLRLACLVIGIMPIVTGLSLFGIFIFGFIEDSYETFRYLVQRMITSGMGDSIDDFFIITDDGTEATAWISFFYVGIITALGMWIVFTSCIATVSYVHQNSIIVENSELMSESSSEKVTSEEIRHELMI